MEVDDDYQRYEGGGRPPKKSRVERKAVKYREKIDSFIDEFPADKFNQGIVMDREPTDTFWSKFFFVFVIIILGVLIFAISQGWKAGLILFAVAGSEEFQAEYSQDLFVAKTSIGLSIVSCFVWSLICIQFLSAYAEQVAWCLIYSFVVLLGGMSCLFLYAFTQARDNDGKTGALVGAGMYALFAVLYVLMVWCYKERIETAIDVVDGSADFLAKTKRIMYVAIAVMFVQMIFVFLFLCAVIALGFAYAEASKGLIFFLFCSLMWIMNCTNATTYFVTMLCASTYYFDSNASREGSGDVSKSIEITKQYHFGSICYGSLIITGVQILEMMFQSLIEEANRGDAPLALHIVLCICSCIIRSIEELIDYLQKAAYAYMAITGEDFCKAGWNGLMLNMAYGIEFAWAQNLASWFTLTGIIFIVLMNCLTFQAFLTATGEDQLMVAEDKSFMFVVFASFFIAKLFLGLMDEVALALCTCLCIDRACNGQPKFGPPTFHDRLGKIKRVNREDFY